MKKQQNNYTVKTFLNFSFPLRKCKDILIVLLGYLLKKTQEAENEMDNKIVKPISKPL